MDNSSKIILLGIVISTLLTFLIVWLYFVLEVVKIRKLDKVPNVINRNYYAYKIATTFSFRYRQLLKGSWKYKLWWTSLADIFLTVMVMIYLLVLILSKPKMDMAIMVVLAICMHIALIFGNFGTYMKVGNEAELYMRKLETVDELVKRFSTSHEATIKYLKEQMDMRAKSDINASVSIQDLRGIFIDCLNKYPRPANHTKREQYIADLEKVFITCCIVLSLYQQPLAVRYESLNIYLTEGRVAESLYKNAREFDRPDLMGYLDDPLCSIPKTLLTPQVKSQMNANISKYMNIINAQISALVPSQLTTSYYSYISGQRIWRFFVFLTLVAAAVMLSSKENVFKTLFKFIWPHNKEKNAQ